MMYKGLLLVIFILFSTNAMADSFRCGRALVKSGDTSNMLLKKCGSPVRQYKTYETINDHGRKYDTGVINYVYERSGKKDMIVSVRNGVVVKIYPD